MNVLNCKESNKECVLNIIQLSAISLVCEVFVSLFKAKKSGRWLKTAGIFGPKDYMVYS